MTPAACLRCNRPMHEHSRWTAEEVAATKGTAHPVADSVVGQWHGHDPLTATTRPHEARTEIVDPDPDKVAARVAALREDGCSVQVLRRVSYSPPDYHYTNHALLVILPPAEVRS